MDCKQADNFIMQYAEKTIKPNDAKNLTKHLLICEDCRKSFVAFDVCLDETHLVEAPADFTVNVMAKIKESGEAALPALTPDLASKHKRSYLSPGIKQAIVGVSTILAGIILFFVLNLGIEIGLLTSASQYVINSSYFLNPIVETIGFNLSSSVRFGQFTFLFIPLLSLLLFVLHNFETSSGDSLKA